jgi:hypothetical protein
MQPYKAFVVERLLLFNAEQAIAKGSVAGATSPFPAAVVAVAAVDAACCFRRWWRMATREAQPQQVQRAAVSSFSTCMTQCCISPQVDLIIG